MKNKIILFCIAAISLGSCQKELTDDNPPVFWAVTGITVSNADIKEVVAQYNFEYDSVKRQATMMNYQNFSLGVSRTIYPLYSKDTVYLGQDSYLTLDPSKRVKILTEFNARPGIANGDYYYNYNGQGQLEERLLDDGMGDAIRTTFNYNNGDLVKYKQDFKGYPLANSSTLSYLTAPKINGFGQYSLLEVFPELLLYMPCLSIGKPVSYPVSQIDSQVDIPGSPANSFITLYSNYTLTPEGYISTYQTKVQVGLALPVNTLYEFTYRSFK
jgi:hypothetical protein